MLLKAQDELLSGDEEQAYILYMRFIDIYKIIYASKEYKRDKAEISKLLPMSKVRISVCYVVHKIPFRIVCHVDLKCFGFKGQKGSG